MRRHGWRIVSEIFRLKESAEEYRRFIRDGNDFVRCLAIEFEIEFGLGPTIVPVAKTFQLIAPEASLGQRSASNRDADPRRLSSDAALLRDRFGRSDDAVRNETWPAFVLAGEDKDYVARCDVLASIHRLLSGERERCRPRIINRGFDRERHFLSTRAMTLSSFLAVSGIKELQPASSVAEASLNLSTENFAHA